MPRSWNLPRALPLGVRLQVPGAGACWESACSSNVRRNDAAQFKATSD